MATPNSTATASTNVTAATTATGTTGTTTSGGTTTTTPSAAASSSCRTIPKETAGPYPADGSNASVGSTSNALALGGIVRSDIRSSIAGGTGLDIYIARELMRRDGGTLRLGNRFESGCAPI